jgi:hypothetical protein
MLTPHKQVLNLLLNMRKKLKLLLARLERRERQARLDYKVLPERLELERLEQQD